MFIVSTLGLLGCRCPFSDAMPAAALAVTDEVALPIRAVGDLAAAADVSREEVAVITQCAALGELLAGLPLFCFFKLDAPVWMLKPIRFKDCTRVCNRLYGYGNRLILCMFAFKLIQILGLRIFIF